MNPRSVTRAESIAPWVAGALLALPVLLSRFPPMADVPLHEAVVGLLRHWGDPRYVPPNVYQLNLGLGNQLLSFLMLALAYVVPIGVATKLIVAATLVAIPVAAGRLASHLGVTRWAAVVLAPIGLGWMFFWGLLSNLMGLALYLSLLPSFDRFCERPTARRFPGICAAMVLLHFTHDFMALVAAGTLVVFTVCRPEPTSEGSRSAWRANVVRLIPVLLVLSLALSTRAAMERIMSRAHRKEPSVEWMAIGHKLKTIPGTLYGGYEPSVRDLIFVVCLVPTILFAIERWKNRARDARTWRPRAWTREHRFEILAASLFAAYLVAPASAAPGTALIYHRFLAPAWIVLTLTACTRVELAKPWRLPRLLAAFVPLAPLFASLPTFAENDRVFTGLDAAIAHMDPGSTYLVVELGPTSDNPFVHPRGGGGHVVAVLGGRGYYDFSSFEAAPVHQRPDAQWTTIVERMKESSYAMMPSYDLTHFRYVLLHSPDATIADVAVLALEPEARRVARDGEWTVMESALPQVPIDAPDEPTPTPAPKTLHERCREVVERIRKSPM